MGRGIGTAAALGAVVLWSTNAWAADVALGRMSVAWLLLIQFGTAALAYGLALVVRSRRAATARRGERRPPGRRAIGLGVVGLAGTIFLQYVAFALAPIVAANVLTYGWPLLVALWVAATRRTPRALVGGGLAGVGFLGVVLIFLDPVAPVAEGGPDAGAGPVLGYLAALGSAICMAVYTLDAGRTGVDATDLLLPATIVGVAASGALVLVTGEAPPGAGGIAVAAFIGLGPMAAGYALWTRAMVGDGASRLAPLGYATPMLSTVLLLATGAPAAVATLTGITLVLVCSLGVLAAARRNPDDSGTAGTMAGCSDGHSDGRECDWPTRSTATGRSSSS